MSSMISLHRLIWDNTYSKDIGQGLGQHIQQGHWTRATGTTHTARTLYKGWATHTARTLDKGHWDNTYSKDIGQGLGQHIQQGHWTRATGTTHTARTLNKGH
ncbi:hypothetical protein DPMN_080606 [Dreissena polymorpha]|uniref:Uncharacterized protein n=1 Tax=Dreissena polymorpha TaxID=45954 RepID=A0A9D4BR30_DREPO|nr:hypothetical protein DPMN_080606 [Dreissena polymorpha]